MIEIKGLHKRFGKNEVLKNTNLSLQGPGIFAILGPNGSGKTTLIKSILSMVLPQKGEILVNGEPISKSWRYREQVDYLPQLAQFPENLRVKELFAMIKDLRGQKDADESALVERLGLGPYLNQKLGKLSGGTKQKVNLVLAFVFDHPIIILDEPTTGLDPVMLLILKDMILEAKAAGKLILLSSHITSFVEALADEVIFLLEGKVYFKGSVSALLEESQEKDFEHAIAHLLRGGSDA